MLRILYFPGAAWILGKFQKYTEKVGEINGDLWGGVGTWSDYVAQSNAFGIKFFLESCVFLELPGFLENSRNIQKSREINKDPWGRGGTLCDYVAHANVLGISFFLESSVFLELPGFLENSKNIQKSLGKSMETFGGEGAHCLNMYQRLMFLEPSFSQNPVVSWSCLSFFENPKNIQKPWGTSMETFWGRGHIV